MLACRVCGRLVNVAEMVRPGVCNSCIESWKDTTINMILTDLSSGDPKIRTYKCICRKTIYFDGDHFCSQCGNRNLFSYSELKWKINSRILKKIFNNTLMYKRISKITTNRILWSVFGLDYKSEGSSGQVKVAIDLEKDKVVLSRTCNWQLLSSLFELYYPNVIPRNEGDRFNRKIEKHMKEIYNLDRVTDDDVCRIVSEYENIDRFKISTLKIGLSNEKIVTDGANTIISGKYGNKDLILKYLRSKTWSSPLSMSERKSKIEERKNESKENKEEKDMKKTEQRERLPIKESKDEVYKDQEGNIHIHISEKKNVYVHGPVEVFKYNSKPTKPQVENYPPILDKIDEDTSPGDVLTIARKESGLTQRELAEKIGVSQRAIVTYEHDRVPIKSTRAKQLGEALEIPSELLTI